MSNPDVEDLDSGTVVPGLDGNVTDDPAALRLSISAWTVAVNGVIYPVIVFFTLITNIVVCAVLLRPGAVRYCPVVQCVCDSTLRPEIILIYVQRATTIYAMHCI